MRIRNKAIMLILSLVLIFPLMAASLACTTAKTNMPVVLFSDFGTEDYRVSQLKGIILSHNPDARLIDASHGVPAFDVNTGAFMLLMAAKEFPEKVVFVAVVNTYYRPDPRYLVLTNKRDQVFVSTDNGLLTYIIREMGIKSLYSVDNQELFEKPMSGLSGEMVEGTVGARVSAGYPLKDLGSAVTNPQILDIQQPAIADNQLLGTVIFVDKFGNCVTNITESLAIQYGLAPGAAIQVQNGSNAISARFGTIYSDVPKGKEIAFVNSNLGVVQLSINLGNYANVYNLKAGSKIGIKK